MSSAACRQLPTCALQLADAAVGQGAHSKLLPLLRSGDAELRASAAFVIGALLPARHYAEQRPQPHPMGGSPHASMHGNVHNGRNSEMGSTTILPVKSLLGRQPAPNCSCSLRAG